MKLITQWKEIKIIDLPKEKAYCYWQKVVHEDTEEKTLLYYAQCREDIASDLELDSDYTYCPYCGKKIKMIVEVAMFIEEDNKPKPQKKVEKYVLNGVCTTREEGKLNEGI